ncbi:leucine--tRNA ligase, partial [Patescibacteria group bacterium]|nr:leucine--tRNA ligase [Patescibacteria group bacterium]
MKYPHREIEKKWQTRWEAEGVYRAEDGSNKEKFYTLVEFPYPSGAGLHVGHPRSYTALDIVSRKKRMEGKNVLFPMGWDAFGLPTENYAIKTGRPPAEITKENIDTFRRQLQSIGFSFDWSREVDTTDPAYYKWTQWMFIQFFKAGLCYKAKMAINWCPKDKIGLANEEVVGGACERCGGPVEKREKEQWMIAITKYADRLLSDLDTVDYLPKIKKQQADWIGRSEGAEVDFVVETEGSKGVESTITVFTTRPDTLFGSTYLVLAPEHPLIATVVTPEQRAAVDAYITATQKKTEMERGDDTKEKTGVFSGAYAINPVNKERIPIWVADYVLSGYGTGAIMAVPAHDERDFAFAKKFGLEIRSVINRQKYAIFDFDGVLGNTFEAGMQAFVDMGEKPSLAEAKESMIAYARKKPNHVRNHTMTPEQLAHTYQWTERYGKLMEQNDLPLFENFIDEILQIPNIQIGVVSSGSELYVKPAMEKSRLTPSHIFGFEEHYSKEEKIERICKAWSISVKDVWYFTDTKADVLELSDLLDTQHIIGCAWGYLGKEELEEALPREQVLENFSDIHRVFSSSLHVGDGTLVNSDFLNGLQAEQAKEKMISWLESQRVGRKKVTYRLRDWVFSRQRYWGEPIPLVHCENGCAKEQSGWLPVEDKQLPLVLPVVEKYQPTDNGESPLAAMTDWLTTTCPKCGGVAHRETDTMPNWAGSSWYFLRYIDPKNDKEFASKEKLKYWMPIDLYNGGMEHTTLHLLYSRFWNKVLFDLGFVPTAEPYARRHSHGLIMAEDGAKMSKSKGNVVNPDDIVQEFGADTLRVYEMFMGPFEEPVPWSTNGVVGVRRFLDRIHGLAMGPGKTDGPGVQKLLHKTIKKITEDIEGFHFNTAVSALMIFVNAWHEQGASKETIETFLKILSPFAPHLAEECWAALGHTDCVVQEPWPAYDPALIK